MSDLSTYGSLVLIPEVEDSLEATLKEWIPYYAAYVSRKAGKPGFLPDPKSYVATSDFDHFPEEKCPAVLLECGEIMNPIADGRREYRATFPLRVGIFVESKNRDATERLAKLYEGAIRQLILHRGSLGHKGWATIWKATKINPEVANRSQRTIASAEIHFSTEVRGAAQRLGGPVSTEGLPNPKTEPGQEAPAPHTVQRVDIAVRSRTSQ